MSEQTGDTELTAQEVTELARRQRRERRAQGEIEDAAAPEDVQAAAAAPAAKPKAKKAPAAAAATDVEPELTEAVERKPVDPLARIAEANDEQETAITALASVFSRVLKFQAVPMRLPKEQSVKIARTAKQVIVSTADRERHAPFFEAAGLSVKYLDWMPQGFIVVMRKPGDVNVVRLES